MWAQNFLVLDTSAQKCHKAMAPLFFKVLLAAHMDTPMDPPTLREGQPTYNYNEFNTWLSLRHATKIRHLLTVLYKAKAEIMIIIKVGNPVDSCSQNCLPWNL